MKERDAIQAKNQRTDPVKDQTAGKDGTRESPHRNYSSIPAGVS